MNKYINDTEVTLHTIYLNDTAAELNMSRITMPSHFFSPVVFCNQLIRFIDFGWVCLRERERGGALMDVIILQFIICAPVSERGHWLCNKDFLIGQWRCSQDHRDSKSALDWPEWKQDWPVIGWDTECLFSGSIR